MIQHDDYIDYETDFSTEIQAKVTVKPRKLLTKHSCQNLSSNFCRVECVKARNSGCSVFSCSRYKIPQCLGWGKNRT